MNILIPNFVCLREKFEECPRINEASRAESSGMARMKKTGETRRAHRFPFNDAFSRDSFRPRSEFGLPR